MRRVAAISLLLVLGAGGPASGQQSGAVRSDLDTLMEKVLANRDANWKALQQYILDERQRVDLGGPGGIRIWGEEREYVWYLRDGYFVRSPLKVNGVEIGEADRRQAEQTFLAREKERDKKQTKPGDRGAAPTAGEAPTTVEGLIRQTREPQFISSAYFLRFKFEPGRYALVGRERFEGLEVLRIEYYPERLFGGNENRRPQREKRERQFEAEVERLVNKVSLVTLWVEPQRHQILKFTFDNVGFDFLPASWLLRVGDLRASMVMSQAFPDVWLPKIIDTHGSVTMAIGRFEFSYDVEYHDYRKADVTSTIRVGRER